jgi:hypothetical protein
MVFFDKDFINDTKYKIHYDKLDNISAGEFAEYGLHLQDGKNALFWVDREHDDAIVGILKCEEGESQTTFYLDDSILAKEIAPDIWKLVLRKTA